MRYHIKLGLKCIYNSLKLEPGRPDKPGFDPENQMEKWSRNWPRTGLTRGRGPRFTHSIFDNLGRNPRMESPAVDVRGPPSSNPADSLHPRPTSAAYPGKSQALWSESADWCCLRFPSAGWSVSVDLLGAIPRPGPVRPGRPRPGPVRPGRPRPGPSSCLCHFSSCLPIKLSKLQLELFQTSNTTHAYAMYLIRL